jgi:hypothetical protein
MNNQTALTTDQDPAALTVMNDIMTQAGQAANEAGARHAFADHTARKAERRSNYLWTSNIILLKMKYGKL